METARVSRQKIFYDRSHAGNGVGGANPAGGAPPKAGGGKVPGNCGGPILELAIVMIRHLSYIPPLPPNGGGPPGKPPSPGGAPPTPAAGP